MTALGDRFLAKESRQDSAPARLSWGGAFAAEAAPTELFGQGVGRV
jgi:hypothetical protein